MNNKVSIFVAVILSVVVTSIFFIVLESNDSDNEITPFESNETKISNSEFSPSSEIKKINSEMELKEIISTSSKNQNFFVEPRMIRTAIFEESMVMDSVQSLPTPSAMTENSKIQGTEYSTTNNQVTGVDEPDFIKNDSKYIYIVSGNTITIIDGYPGESAKVILKTAIDVEYQYIENMFLNNNRLVIFYNDQSNEEIIPEFDFMPRPTYQPITHVMIIDISDKQNLKILKDYSIDGNFSQARMIGDNVYFVTNSYIDYQFPRFPVIFENSKKIMNPDAFYFENSEEMTNFNTITALNIIDYTINSETFLSGYSGTFYVSEKNFYITYQQNIPYRFYQDLAKEKFFEVILPFFSNEIQAQINVIYENDKTDSEKWAEISEIIESQYDKMNKQEKEELFKKINLEISKFDARVQQEFNKTIIHKISIDETNLQYVAKGSVPGRLLNQFSLDENKDKLRVATTLEYYLDNQGMTRTNGIYNLDKNLELVGSLENVAKDESIFSARFMGDRLYLVTFQQIDPFFVIDLSSDTPKILGELKIPGFSNYLHPFDENTIIGLGRDTKISEDNRVEQLGIKIALYDVQDVNNPQEVSKFVIGDSSSYSEATYNHKAFFFDKTRNVISIPISEDIKSTSSGFAPNYQRWNGFYIFSIDKNIELKGTIEHSDNSQGYYGFSNSRTFFIDETLYTVSNSKLKINNIEDLVPLNEIQLENSGQLINYIQKSPEIMESIEVIPSEQE
ncbi:MAG: beta-propeller domain-containing protein [Nitrosopumilus sp.]